MSKIDDIMDTVNEQLAAIDELNSFFKLGICIFLTVLAFQIVKYGIVRPWGRIVMSTETAWDDKLHRPIASRAYFFLISFSCSVSSLLSSIILAGSAGNTLKSKNMTMITPIKTNNVSNNFTLIEFFNYFTIFLKWL